MTAPQSPTARRRGLLAVTAALSATALIHGLSLPMFALVLEHHGVGESAIGINTTAQYLAIFAAAPFAGRLMRTIGPAQLMFWSVIVGGLIFVLLPLRVDVYTWFALRLVLGMTQALMWIAGESWVSQLAEEHRRGRVIAIYGAVTSAGFAAGPLLLSIVGPLGWTPFLIAGGLLLVASIVLAFVLPGAPKLEGQTSGSLLRYAFKTPVATWVYFAFAACDAMLLTFLPIYGEVTGLSQSAAITLLTVMACGSIAGQYPIGRLADRMNGMVLTVLTIASLVVLCAAIPFVIAYTPLNFIVFLLIGCAFGALYTLSLVLIGRRFQGAELGAAATVRGLVFCMGSMIGPPLVGALMQWSGASSLPISMAITFALALPICIIGWRRGWTA